MRTIFNVAALALGAAGIAAISMGGFPALIAAATPYLGSFATYLTAQNIALAGGGLGALSFLGSLGGGKASKLFGTAAGAGGLAALGTVFAETIVPGSALPIALATTAGATLLGSVARKAEQGALSPA